jgi:hypothetical protein
MVHVDLSFWSTILYLLKSENDYPLYWGQKKDHAPAKGEIGMYLFRHNPLYRTLMASGAVSALGDSIYYIALLTYASSFPDPSRAILLVTLSETIPGVLSVFLGVLSDRTANKAKTLYATFWLRGGICLLIGLMMGLDSSWPLLAAVALLNFSSDLLGKYAASLQFPFMVQVVNDSQLEQASGWNSAVQRVMGVVSQLAGSFLILWFSYRMLAWLNGATFAAGGLILSVALKKLVRLEKKRMKKEELPAASVPFFKQMKYSVLTLFANKQVFPVVIQITLINAALYPLSALFSMHAAAGDAFIVGSFSLTVALFSSAGSVGVVLGNLAAGGLFRKTGLSTIIGWSYGAVLGYCAGLLLQSPLLAVGMYTMACACVGLLSPKYGALFARQVEREQLASVAGASQTLGHLGGPLSSVLIGELASGISLLAGTWALAALVMAGFGCLMIPSRRPSAAAAPHGDLATDGEHPL